MRLPNEGVPFDIGSILSRRYINDVVPPKDGLRQASYGLTLLELLGCGEHQVQVRVVSLEGAPVLSAAAKCDDDPLVKGLLEHIEWSKQCCFTVVIGLGPR